MVMAFRGEGKSWIADCFALWILLNHPEHTNIIIRSANRDRAAASTHFMFKLIDEIPVLRHLRPRAGQRSSTMAFDVGPAEPMQTPSVFSVGIGGQVTGHRADLIIDDDVEIPNNSETVVQREKLAERIKEAESLLKPETGRIIVLGTPQTEDSIYKGLPDRGFDVRVWPAKYPDRPLRDSYRAAGVTLAPRLEAQLESNPGLAGHPTEPERFGSQYLAEKAVSLGKGNFGLNFMLDPRLADEDQYPLKISDLMFHPLDPKQAPERLVWCGTPEYVLNDLQSMCVGMRGDRIHKALVMPTTEYRPYQGIIMGIDPAGTGKDETAYCVMAHLNGQLFLLDVGGLKGYSTETLVELSEIAKKYQVNRVVVEANFGDGMFSQLLRPVLQGIWKTSIDEVKHSTQKERRIIDTLRPLVQSHRIICDTALVSKDYQSVTDRPVEEQALFRFFYQFTRVTRERGSLKHDDRLDVVAMTAAQWVSQMNMSIDRAIEIQRSKDLDKQLAEFCKAHLGKSPRKPSWIGHV